MHFNSGSSDVLLTLDAVWQKRSGWPFPPLQIGLIQCESILHDMLSPCMNRILRTRCCLLGAGCNFHISDSLDAIFEGCFLSYCQTFGIMFRPHRSFKIFLDVYVLPSKSESIFLWSRYNFFNQIVINFYQLTKTKTFHCFSLSRY